jgi:glycosyltransferase involved in cell wall biosynthesis
MKKLLIAHGFWGRGGAEIATMQLVEILKDEFEIYLLTRGGWDLNELNLAANTTLSALDIKMIKLPLQKLMSNTTCGHLWHAFFLRHCRKIAKKYDICITASRTIGWGRPAVHFLSDVIWNKKLNQLYGETVPEKNLVKRILKKTSEIIADKSLYELHDKDIFIANSHWTSKISKPYTTTNPIVIYPSVIADFKEIEWGNRKNEFVSFGRIAIEKKIEDSIAIVEKLRYLGHNIGLTIFGEFDNSDYAQSIKILAQDKPWVKMLGAIYGDQKTNILPMFKYGINTCQREAFGISTAEMMQAGIIPFVPLQGAQKEIVVCENLIFENIDSAVTKIDSILKSIDLQKSILSILKEQSDRFSTEQFKQQIKQLFLNLPQIHN